REVFDVSGAGDTVIATFALSLAAGADRVQAATIANAAGGVVVGKRGTARLTVEELSGALFRSHGPVAHKDAILDANAAARMVAASVRRLKGPGRPVNDQHDRACVLAALASVDAVVVFEEDTPLKLIEALLPDILVKGADYTIETVVGADVVQNAGGRVVLVDLVAGKSTTKTIGKLRAGGAN
ncbi:MAG: bifunctional heptose 7-phosphate kinase/heptose 1-phosphate adenyltransferase, partial [Mesorhizobium sp.]